MSNYLLGFPNKKERDDFLIALIVIVFFGWIMTRTLGCNKTEANLNPIEENIAAVVDDPMLADKDGDGVVDTKDHCPNIAGILENNGCPLEMDAEEKTVNVEETTSKKVPTRKVTRTITETAAPVAGAISGIVDTKKTDVAVNKVIERPEPTKPAKVTNDADRDGIIDSEDKCPNLTGTAANNGCPADKDGDGVYDNIDKCPTVAGVKENKGCPADKDGDGVADKDDKCPNDKGIASNNGCPKVTVNKEEAEILKSAIQSIEFDTGKSRVKRASLKILDKIVPILKKYPNYKLDIIGHTDNRGKADQNLKLSRNRAKACLNYLVSKGIAANRITSSGKGDTQPIESNDTNDGRSKNRRVEFNLQN